MVKADFLLLLILAGLVMAVIPAAGRQPEPPVIQYPNAAARAFARAARERQIADQRLWLTLSHLESYLDLPEATFGPAWSYHPSQREGVTRHLQDLNTRLRPLSDTESPDYTIYASPALTRSTEQDQSRHTLALLRVYRDGRIVPVGFTQVRPGVPEGHDVNFMDAVVMNARATWRSLALRYGGNIRIVDP